MKRYKEYVFNPVLFYGIGLYPILAICTSTQTSIKFGLILFFSMLLCSIIGYIFKPMMLDNIRIPAYMLITIGVEYFIDSVISEFWITSYSGIANLISYVFVAVIIIFMFEKSREKNTFAETFSVSFKVAIEYVLCLIFVGLLREYLGSGSIWGKPLGNFSGLPFFNTFAGGLLLLIVFAVVYNIFAFMYKKKRVVFLGLVDRYTLYMENNAVVDGGDVFGGSPAVFNAGEKVQENSEEPIENTQNAPITTEGDANGN